MTLQEAYGSFRIYAFIVHFELHVNECSVPKLCKYTCPLFLAPLIYILPFIKLSFGLWLSHEKPDDILSWSSVLAVIQLYSSYSGESTLLVKSQALWARSIHDSWDICRISLSQTTF